MKAVTFTGKEFTDNDQVRILNFIKENEVLIMSQSHIKKLLQMKKKPIWFDVLKAIISIRGLDSNFKQKIRMVMSTYPELDEGLDDLPKVLKKEITKMEANLKRKNSPEEMIQYLKKKKNSLSNTEKAIKLDRLISYQSIVLQKSKNSIYKELKSTKNISMDRNNWSNHSIKNNKKNINKLATAQAVGAACGGLVSGNAGVLCGSIRNYINEMLNQKGYD